MQKGWVGLQFLSMYTLKMALGNGLGSHFGIILAALGASVSVSLVAKTPRSTARRAARHQYSWKGATDNCGHGCAASLPGAAESRCPGCAAGLTGTARATWKRRDVHQPFQAVRSWHAWTW